MPIKHFLFILISTFLFFCSSAQKKKEIKKYGIKTIITTKIQGTKTLKDERLTYNREGLLIEQIKYDDEGTILFISKYKYNLSGDLIEETECDQKNQLIEKRITKYNALSQKVEELVLDKQKKQIKKFTYTYNNKGLRTEKKTFDGNNKLVLTKKQVYTYN